MSITISKEPTTPNMSEADLVYRVISTKVNEPQFKFVCDVQDESRNTLVRLKQQPNPNSNGIFNVGTIIDDYLGMDEAWKAAPIKKTGEGFERYFVAFGEEYGTSTSSSVEVYKGTADTTGAPAKSGSSLYLSQGVVERTSGDFNFASASFYRRVDTPTDGSGTGKFNLGLTNAPLTQSVRSNEYLTLTMYNGDLTDGRLTSGKAQDVYYFQVTGYPEANGGGTALFNQEFFNLGGNGGGPRTVSSQLYPAVSGSLTDNMSTLHIGMGIENLKEVTPAVTGSSVKSYTVVCHPQADDNLEDGGIFLESRMFNVVEGECGYDGVRFAFINELGTWDYYTFPLADSKRDSITRNNFNKNDIDYGNLGNYDSAARGSRTYNMSYKEQRSVESNYLTQAEADWLRELIESPNVYMQDGDDFIAVTLTNANFEYKTNPRSQKLYTLRVEFEVSKQRRSR